jgi:hemoglobin
MNQQDSSDQANSDGQHNQPQISEADIYRLIGQEGFARIARGFYRQIPGDDILGPMYPADEMQAAEDRLREFLVQRFGGPTDYSNKRGHPRLRMRHAPFAIDSAARDRWMQIMTRSLEEAGLDSRVKPILLAYFESTATFMMNRPG